MSQSYKALVDSMLSFPDPDALTKARHGLKTPGGEPAETPSPPGWTKVPDGAGILRWQPDWSVSTTPERWLAEVAGESRPPTTLRIPVRELASHDQASLVMAAGADAALQALAPRNDELQALEISAQAWGCVLVGPGDWFDPEITALASCATFRDGCALDMLLGPDGLLTAQITGLLVAADPVATLTAEASYWRRNARQLESAEILRIAGWSFGSVESSLDRPVLDATPAPNGAVQLSVRSPRRAAPQIAGIYVHPFRV
jgi:hypothetical protein